MRFVADLPDYLGRGGPYLHELGHRRRRRDWTAGADHGVGRRNGGGTRAAPAGDAGRGTEIGAVPLSRAWPRKAPWAIGTTRWEATDQLPMLIEVTMTDADGREWPAAGGGVAVVDASVGAIAARRSEIRSDPAEPLTPARRGVVAGAVADRADDRAGRRLRPGGTRGEPAGPGDVARPGGLQRRARGPGVRADPGARTRTSAGNGARMARPYRWSYADAEIEVQPDRRERQGRPQPGRRVVAGGPARRASAEARSGRSRRPVSRRPSSTGAIPTS